MAEVKILNFIAGDFQAPCSGEFLANIEPATGKSYSQVASSGPADLELAIDAAEKAFPAWQATPEEKRSKILARISDLIERDLEKLALAESTDTGKPLTLARSVDIPRAAQNLRFFSHAITQHTTECHPSQTMGLNFTLRQPLGIVGCITPWNLPLHLFTWKIAPALACGNCVIGKPSELTPMTAFMLASICQEAGLPAGVLNIVNGLGSSIGSEMLSHPKIRAISFTGGSKTGQEVAIKCAKAFKKYTLELGGKNPNIIFADCSYQAALDSAVRAAFSNQGQICLCGSRVLVEAEIYENFKRDFVDRAKALRCGDPLDAGTDQGALVSEPHMQKVLGCIETAKHEGGEILCGGKRASAAGRCSNGFFVEPTVIEGLPPACSTNQEEIFGPVASLIPFENEAEAISIANGTRYGLAASVWTSSLDRAHRLGSALQSGVVWVNCWMVRDLRTPFGGTKSSGIGREGGLDALRFFTETKNICIKVQNE
ncbi:MAG: 2-hydroxymuconic semialdehyde dehydrogenase [Proteobacteria bacterium]|nr:MAG: 2-hydroxymuconic semialdehyde dehydrogenase [Pseudomonadota bacterium]